MTGQAFMLYNISEEMNVDIAPGKCGINWQEYIHQQKYE